jgi:hypothetical protein
MKLVMNQQQLKSMVESGAYRPQPDLIAAAMLRRRGVLALLTGSGFGAADRIQPPPAVPRQAA